MVKITKNKKLARGPIDLIVDRAILIDSININELEWQIDKTNEALIALADRLNHFKRNDVSSEEVHSTIGNVAIQLAIIVEIFGYPSVQAFMDGKMDSIKKRNRRKSHKIGFVKR